MKKIFPVVCVALMIGVAGCAANSADNNSAGNAGSAAGQASSPCTQGAAVGAPVPANAPVPASAAGSGGGQSGSCGSTRSLSSEPSIGSIPTVTSASQLQLPLDQYELSLPQLNQVISAQNLAAHVCLQRLGINVSEHVFSPTETNVPRYQLHYLPLATAQADGYATTSPLTSAGGSSGGSDAPSQEASSAFFGSAAQVNGKPVPKGGCSTWGMNAINSPKVTPDPLDYIYNAEISTLSDTRMLQAFSKWSTCMSGKGFTYQTPMQAQSGSKSGSWPSTPSQAEIATATADATCRNQVNLQGLWVALMTAYENQEISKDLPVLLHDHQVTQEWLSNAASYGA